MYTVIYKHEGQMKRTGKFETIQEANAALKEIKAEGIKEATIRKQQSR